VLVAIVATLGIVTVVSTRAANATRAQALDRAAELVTVLLDRREQGLARAAAVFVQNPIFRALVLDESVDDLNDQSMEGAERTGATWVQIVNARGERLAKSDDPAAPRVSLTGSALIARALGGELASGIGASGDSLLLQVIAVPVVVPGATAAQTVGAFMAAQVIDSALAAEVRRATDTDVVFYVSDTAQRAHVAASSLGARREVQELVERATLAMRTGDGREATTTDSTARSETESATDAAPAASAEARFDGTVDGVAYVARAVVLRTAGGEALGGFLALRARDADLAPFIALRRWIFLAGLLSLTLGAVISFLVARSIAGPVLDIAAATRRAAEGDYNAHIAFRSGDEIGALADAVRTMLADLREKYALVKLLQASTPREAHLLSRLDSRAALREKSGADAGELSRAGAAEMTGDEVIGTGMLVSNRYEIRSTLGTGGAGIVYKAFDHELQEVIALKTLHPSTAAQDPTAIERLKSEIRLARSIAHRGVVRTYDLGESNGHYFLTMEYVAGTPLSDLIARAGKLPQSAVFSIARQLARALEVAHEQGIIHRDIKPQNLMVQPDGTLKVMDFGIARLATRAAGVTQVGTVVGTVEYMAPEQILDGNVDARADLYACGVVLYECLTGRLPHEITNPMALVARFMAKAEVTDPAAIEPGVPRELSALVMRLLAIEPSERTESAAQLHEELVRAEART